MKHGLWMAPLAFLASCDKAKAFIDPTGHAYGAPASQTQPTNGPVADPTAKPGAVPPPPPAPVGQGFDAPVRAPAIGRNLTATEVLRQVSGIEFQDKQGEWTFHNGVGRRGSMLASLLDSGGKTWGISVGDLDLDGSDDAVVLVRLDRADEEPRWELAFLRNQEGRLFNTQTVVLPGAAGYREVDIQGSAVVLVPQDGGPNVTLSYSGGELALSRP